MFVSGLTRLTVAPATTLPCGSVTVPRTEDVPVCADAVAQKSASRREQRSASAPLPEAVGLVIVLSLTGLGGRRGRRPRKDAAGRARENCAVTWMKVADCGRPEGLGPSRGRPRRDREVRGRC